ncbi:MAG: hypothetical protein EWV49_08285 [Microcystis aeruginosa Ma_QC_Ch_20071001_S25]|uniref:Uncharacterized protein n=1 Tax=Microcystis aeruginosa Ma_QC_Ch_20071001_S25D TaxID=2486250 RepID=A0A552FDM6_MICAE|nr:MAG: hypothetical protein EWV57_21780 [Microcystis aeruginosa Ma_QC_Ch_20071001_S25D]TRU50919.1 MAG: hypothetical protein EWV49_08285 [Microcystis aeruginosa Ma_QC_Ch_20071001_S25]TRU63112.1 MAG: hypothetical protein EWV90_09375 [Microcystis aeruginosa Ma_QC_Ch_20071001_M135]
MLGANKSLHLSLLKTLGLIAVIGGLIMVIVEMQQEKVKTLTKEKLLERNYAQESRLENSQVQLFKNIPSFGFNNMLANWAMLQFIQYYGDEDARRETGYGLSPDFMEIVAKNDPKFVRAYLMMSVASSVNAGKPERTIEIMNKGLSKITPDVTDAYFIWLYKGVDELLFLGDIPAAKKSYQMAADWAKIASNEFIEKSARGTVKFLETNPDSRAPRVGAWMLVWINSQDEETRRLAQENIEKLGGKLVVINENQVMAIPPKD